MVKVTDKDDFSLKAKNSNFGGTTLLSKKSPIIAS